MVLAMVVLLLHFPASTTPANAANHAISAKAAASRLGRTLSPPPAESIKRVSFDSTIPVNPASASTDSNAASSAGSTFVRPPAAVQPSAPATKNENEPAAGPVIHSIQPRIVSIARLTGPSSSDAILPPPFRSPFNLPATHHRLWLALSAAEHSAATYDAWSTRRALATGRIEADPLMRPFAGSASLYPAMQLVPFGLDYLAHRLERSSGWAHRVWWLPQSAATVTFLFSGSYNVAHTN